MTDRALPPMSARSRTGRQLTHVISPHQVSGRAPPACGFRACWHGYYTARQLLVPGARRAASSAYRPGTRPSGCGSRGPGRHSHRCRPAESNPSRRVCDKRVTTKRPAATSEKRRPPAWRCSWRLLSGRAALTSSGGGSERLILSLPHSLARYPRARCAGRVLPARSAATHAARESSGAQSVPGHSAGSGRRRKPGR